MKFTKFSTVLALSGLFLLAFITSCRHGSPSEPAQTDSTACCHGMLTVTAQDSLGNPIHAATVTLSGNGTTRTETTGDHGSATLVELCSGVYEYHIVKDGYTTAHGLDTLTCNDTTSITRTLYASSPHSDTSCASGSITLIVDDSATHTALTGGTASLYLNGSLISSKEMSANGTTWTGLHPGRYAFSLSKDGYNPVEFHIDSLSCDQTRTVDHNMSAIHHSTDSCCGGVTEITVTDSSTHHAISGATVVLYKSGTELASATTGSDGGARFPNLCTGSYRMTIDESGYTGGVIEWSETCNATHGFAKGLLAYHSNICDTASITVRLQDSIHLDTYIAGATVTFRLAGSNDIIETGTATDGGYFTGTNLVSPDTYTINFSKDGYNEKSVTMQIGDCRNYHETYQLSPH
jgi:hypothetical protein